MAQTAEPTPEVGQIWREVDPRKERFVLVEAEGRPGMRGVAIRAVVRVEGKWCTAPHSRSTYADLSRFNGKRSGYTFIEAAP